ncbi:hypothetical protein [Streptomyces sp. NPDC127084]|uniref:divisome protein SepX/GlpR n=1 Tax=Streptomyces sp. NPDC127084 TaxID=3347133 RepID=UPI0036509C6E
MSSSGLIYAVIVGAWAAYLVPMWLRRQDELNEARPTERFSTAIRLLSGRAGMERRYAKELRERTAEEDEATTDAEPDAGTDPLSSVDVRSFAAPPARTEARIRPPASAPRPSGAAAARARRSKALARRRRTTVLLFLAFTIGAIVAAVGGLGLLWAPAAPAVLLTAYIAHLRAQERRRYVYVMDRRRAEAAAQRLREKGAGTRPPTVMEVDEQPEEHPVPEPAPRISPQEAGRRALVEQTDHAEWVDQQRDPGPARGDSWDPVPVPLPTYVTAPVAPRAGGGVDITDPDTWSASRSSTAEPTPSPAPPRQRTAPPPRRTRDHGRTPLFDQYADDDRPRAANE